MVTSSSPSRLNDWLRHLRDKGRCLRRGGLDESNGDQIGLLPTEGWQQRNYQFLRNVVIPSMFAKRTGDPLATTVRRVEDERLQVTWIGHATFLVQVSGLNILIDPNWAMWHSIFKRVRRPGISLAELPPIDLILVSHAHYDHLHLKSLAELANGQPILMPRGVSKLVRRFDLEAIEMDWWDKIDIQGLEITFTPARHWGARYVHDLHRGFGGFMLKSPAHTLYHCGDSAYFDGFQEIGNRFPDIDLALLPIGAYDAPSGRSVHMNPEESLDAFRDLGAQRMAPMHYGSFPLGGEPMHEPLERLIYSAGSEGLSHRVLILEEGMPERIQPQSSLSRAV